MEHANGKSRHVLVVDDDAAMMVLYRDVLEDEGYRVTLMDSPDLGPTAVASLAPDLLLLDLRFEGDRTGMGLLQRLKTDAATQTIPVLVCSADHHLLEALQNQLGAWDCEMLTKPFDLDDLLTAIQTCLTHQTAIAPLARNGHIAEQGA
jgi:CheY-like chemotaxis protein